MPEKRKTRCSGILGLIQDIPYLWKARKQALEIFHEHLFDKFPWALLTVLFVLTVLVNLPEEIEEITALMLSGFILAYLGFVQYFRTRHPRKRKTSFVVLLCFNVSAVLIINQAISLYNELTQTATLEMGILTIVFGLIFYFIEIRNYNEKTKE